MLSLNDKNLLENLFEISEEDMAAAAPSFNVIEEEKIITSTQTLYNQM